MESFSVEGLTAITQSLLPEPHSGLLVGLLFGTKASLSREFYNALVASGTLHIIALSGMNVTIIMNMIASSIEGKVGKRWASVASIVAVVWFVWFVGPTPSIVRAAIMGSISLFAVIFGRQYWALFSWVLAIVIMLGIRPIWAFELSFQLSALATLGIILFGKSPASVSKETQRLSSLFGDIKHAIHDDLHLTLAAQIFTIPLILFHFHRVSLIAPFANLAIGWVIAPLTILGWVTVVLGWVFLPLGYVISWINWVLLEYMIRVIQITSTIPMASIMW